LVAGLQDAARVGKRIPDAPAHIWRAIGAGSTGSYFGKETQGDSGWGLPIIVGIAEISEASPPLRHKNTNGTHCSLCYNFVPQLTSLDLQILTKQNCVVWAPLSFIFVLLAPMHLATVQCGELKTASDLTLSEKGLCRQRCEMVQFDSASPCKSLFDRFLKGSSREDQISRPK
jgi:hypothetical protein